MAVRKRTNAYWQKRSEQRLTESERTSEKYAKQTRKVYQEAQRQTVLELRKMYEAYYKKDEGFDMQALRSIAPSGDIKRFQAQMREAGLSTYLPDNYKGRMTRLELLNAQMWAQAKMAATKHDAIETVAHKKVYEDTYYKTAYDISKGIGGTPSSFSTLDTRTVNRVLSAKFQGKNFSERIWGNTDILAKQLKEKLAVAIATGQSLDKTSRDIRERFGVSKYYADRLIRTESNYFHNVATLDSYRSMGIEEFQFVATLDRRTSEVCQHADGKVFKVKDAIVGVNVPPLHPNCRSTIVPYLKNYQQKTRIYRDPETGRNKYTYNVGYSEWAASIGHPELIRNSNSAKRAGTATKHTAKVASAIQQAAVALTDAQKQAVESYVSGDDMWFNQYLRGRMDEDIQLTPEELARLDELKAATANPLEQDMTLYRSVDASALFGDLSGIEYEHLVDYLVYGDKASLIVRDATRLLNKIKGKELIEKGFMSTTKDKATAMDFGGFTGSDKPVVLELKVPATAKGLSLGKHMKELDKRMGQHEVLLSPGAKYKITDIGANDGQIYIKAEVVSDKLVTKAVAQTAGTIVKPRISISQGDKLTANDFNSSFVKTVASKKNTELFAEYLNSRKDKANPDVLDMYANMGKLYDGNIRVSHAKQSSFGGDYVDGKISYRISVPKISGVDDVASISTTLHEYAHYIDHFAKGAQNTSYASLSSDGLIKAIENDDGKIGKKVSDIILKHKSAQNSMRVTLVNKANADLDKLATAAETGRILSVDYYHERKRLINKLNSDLDKYGRVSCGGGVDGLEDIYDALSGGRLSKTGLVLYGHKGNYYAKTEKRAKEIFANYSMLSVSKPDLVEVLRKDKPELVKALDEIVKQIVGGL